MTPFVRLIRGGPAAVIITTRLAIMPVTPLPLWRRLKPSMWLSHSQLPSEAKRLSQQKRRLLDFMRLCRKGMRSPRASRSAFLSRSRPTIPATRSFWCTARCKGLCRARHSLSIPTTGSRIRATLFFQGVDTTLGVSPAPFRQYKSFEGRWLTPDPAGLAAVDLSNPQSFNRYAYVGNNPTTFVDPLGLDHCTWVLTSEGGTLNCTLDGGGGGQSGIGSGYLPVGGIGPGGGGAGGGGGPSWLCRNLHIACPAPPPLNFTPPPAPNAPPLTLSCQGTATFSDVSQSQINNLVSQGGGALQPGVVPTSGTVAIGGTKTFGLSYAEMRQFGPYITVNPTDLSGTIAALGGPAPPYTVSDIGDINIRNSPGTRYDVYAFPDQTANAFGIQTSNATITVIPNLTGAHCPNGSSLFQGPQ